VFLEVQDIHVVVHTGDISLAASEGMHCVSYFMFHLYSKKYSNRAVKNI